MRLKDWRIAIQKNKNLGHKMKILFIMHENFTKEEK